jgi:hypothetical protein
MFRFCWASSLRRNKEMEFGELVAKSLYRYSLIPILIRALLSSL